MSKKKSPPVGSTTERAAEMAACKASIPIAIIPETGTESNRKAVETNE